MGKSKHEYYNYSPSHNSKYSLGRSDRKFHAVYANIINSPPTSYKSDPMTADETFTDPLSSRKAFFLNPGSAKRTFNPSGDFTTGFAAFVKNIGTTHSIIFDSSGSKQVIKPGQLGICFYTGTEWK